MPSRSLHEWLSVRSRELDELARAHTAVGGIQPGRRFATQQLNRSYAVLLASQFQGFCRDLHTECVNHVLAVLAPPAALHPLIRAELTRQRQLDRANAQPASIGADFGRLGIDFWRAVEAHEPASTTWKVGLTSLNEWRNAIAHHDFDIGKLGGTTILRIAMVRTWRRSCNKLCHAFDAVMHSHMLRLTGAAPW